MKKLAVVLLTLILASAWTAAAFADATPYASVRYATFYSSIDAPVDANDTEDLTFGFVTGNGSRFGVKFKTGDVVGNFEINQAMGLRHLFGSYDFGPGVVLIGQTWVPYAIFGSTGVHTEALGAAGDGSMFSWGSFGHRKPQMRVALKMGLYAALIQNQGDTDAVRTRVDLPELAVGYIGQLSKTLTLGVHGAYMRDEVVRNNNGTTAVTTDDFDVEKNADCFLLAADVNAKFGAFGVLARAFYGQNLASMGLAEGLTIANATVDLDTMGGFVQGSFKISDMLAVNGGGGYVENETAGVDDDRIVYFVNLPVQIAKGFQVIPEIAYYDGMDNNAAGVAVDGNDQLWIGAKWQMDF